eukprot:TRINITY_DN13189_c0_g1_i1.p1 TRINITY_DN13189_c0_g1~~TRINITY_DN13189_c0_g1_i1.p1  ORF type:complete len:104 (-),score=5.97 TRINITY_DN13189_c0_g1_i1:50-361(-)
MSTSPGDRTNIPTLRPSIRTRARDIMLRVIIKYAVESLNLSDVKTPLLLLSALDDPLVSPDCVPYKEIVGNPNLILATTKIGGHVAWHTGWNLFQVIRCLYHS